MGVNSLPKTVNLNSGAFARDGAKADRRWTLQPLKVPNISQCFSKVCEIFKGIVKSINQSISQSINIHLLRHDKMQANNSKQKGNTVSKKKRV